MAFLFMANYTFLCFFKLDQHNCSLVILQNCLGHNSNEDRYSISATWVAPQVSAGDLKIRATIMYNFTTFWDDISWQLTPTVTDPQELGPSMQVHLIFLSLFSTPNSYHFTEMMGSHCKIKNHCHRKLFT